MFTSLFYGLRRQGVNVSIVEWITLMEALHMGMANSSLISFYFLARSVLIKSETQYDAYDRAFLEVFKDIETPPELVAEATKGLEHALPPKVMDQADKRPDLNWDLEELKKKLAERLAQQTEEHHGGGNWVGTGGTSPFGHSGYNPAGVRIGGNSVNRSAVKVAAERHFKDFRADEALTTRQYEMALRKLRLLSTAIEGEPDTLDLDATVEATGKNAGMLELVWARSRKNRIKLIIMMDSGGSMYSYLKMCSQLFQAANKSTHFQDLQFYFFHNCLYDDVFTDPYCMKGRAINFYDFLRYYGSDYRLILVGDASMAASELTMPYGALDWWASNEDPGQKYLQTLANHFEHTVWINPIPEKYWDVVEGAYTIRLVQEIFPMFELTLDGLNAAVKKLKVRK